MNRWALGMVLVGSLGLGGCKSDDAANLYDAPKPLDKMSTEEWCAYYAHYITNPQISAQTKATDIERMRARNCPIQG